PRLVLHIDTDIEIGKQVSDALRAFRFGLFAQIRVVEIYKVDVADAMLGWIAITRIPDALRKAAGTEVPVRQVDLVGPGHYTVDDGICRKNGADTIFQMQSFLAPFARHV
ncbi:MAG: hypothetical protein VW835_09190, partial [Rickettsiales bacterium]